MKKIKFHQVDAFTEKLFGGNPAGVVLNADLLTDDEMQKVAREINLSETAFVLKSDNYDFKIRYFTPQKEVKFCGHATVGTLHSHALEQIFGIEKGKITNFKVETGAGIIEMAVNYTHGIKIEFDAPEIKLKKSQYSHQQIAKILGIAPEAIDHTKPICREETNNFIYMTIKSLNELGKINYDFEKAKEFAEKETIVVFCLLTNETFSDSNKVHSRVFGPAIGLVEDPVTGATQGALAAYLDEYEIEDTVGKIIGSEQGNFVDRPGSLEIKLQKDDGFYKARIFATAKHVFSTVIDIE